MLKLIFWFLLLANTLLFAFLRGYLGNWSVETREPLRVAQQLNADKLQLVAAPAKEEKDDSAELETNVEAQAEPKADAEINTEIDIEAKAKINAKADAGLTAGKSDEKADKKIKNEIAEIEKTNIDKAETPAAPALAATTSCTEIGNFNDSEAQQFSAKLTTLALGNKITRRPIQEIARHMVFIPPLGSRESANKKANELRHLKINDFYIIQEDPKLQWAISLGVFKTEEAARAHLALLSRRGVRSARLGLHEVVATKTVFQFRRLTTREQAEIERIKFDFPQHTLRACDAK